MKIHIAGWPVKVGSRGRQLCAWCGYVLFDVDHARIAVAPGCDEPKPHELGALVAVDGDTWREVPHEDGTALPLNCCASPPVALRLAPSPPRIFPVTDPESDAPDGAVVDGYERVGDQWVLRDHGLAAAAKEGKSDG